MERQIALARSEELRALYEEVAAYPPPEGVGDGPEGAEDAEDAAAFALGTFALPLRIEHGGRC